MFQSVAETLRCVEFIGGVTDLTATDCPRQPTATQPGTDAVLGRLGLVEPGFRP
jgi:hypothetical protein